jgi:hypothetical protein
MTHVFDRGEREHLPVRLSDQGFDCRRIDSVDVASDDKRLLAFERGSGAALHTLVTVAGVGRLLDAS